MWLVFFYLALVPIVLAGHGLYSAWFNGNKNKNTMRDVKQMEGVSSCFETFSKVLSRSIEFVPEPITKHTSSERAN